MIKMIISNLRLFIKFTMKPNLDNAESLLH